MQLDGKKCWPMAGSQREYVAESPGFIESVAESAVWPRWGRSGVQPPIVVTRNLADNAGLKAEFATAHPRSSG